MSRISSGFSEPNQPILGTELAGEIETVGADVKRFKEGDQVYGFSSNMGTYADYICLPEDGALAIKPTNLSYDEAAAVPYGALTALYFLRNGQVQSGEKILIFGASGGVGSYAVQLAKHFGAHVTGVCSTGKMDLVRSLGADTVIDYTEEDFTKRSEVYDIIFDTIGKLPVLRSRRSLKEDGTYIFATFGLPILLQVMWLKLTSRKEAIIGLVEDKPENLDTLTELIESGVIKPVIDRRYPLDQAAEAHRYVESGRKKGQVVIVVQHDSKT
jgi:NADPH:quinone reductase-like Zn-dependent oxidoreductase